MSDVIFRPVENSEDLDQLDHALRNLSYDLGDVHAASRETLEEALTGTWPVAKGLLARQNDETCGAALFNPVFSTLRGAPGTYVSDLWVADAMRCKGLGQRMLVEVARLSKKLWGAAWLSLAVYEHSTESRKFYERLGFWPQGAATVMRLDQAGLARLMKGQ